MIKIMNNESSTVNNYFFLNSPHRPSPFPHSAIHYLSRCLHGVHLIVEPARQTNKRHHRRAFPPRIFVFIRVIRGQTFSVAQIRCVPHSLHHLFRAHRFAPFAPFVVKNPFNSAPFRVHQCLPWLKIFLIVRTVFPFTSVFIIPISAFSFPPLLCELLTKLFFLLSF